MWLSGHCRIEGNMKANILFQSSQPQFWHGFGLIDHEVPKDARWEHVSYNSHNFHGKIKGNPGTWIKNCNIKFVQDCKQKIDKFPEHYEFLYDLDPGTFEKSIADTLFKTSRSLITVNLEIAKQFGETTNDDAIYWAE